MKHPSEIHGDEQLAERLRSKLGARHRVAAVAVVTPDETRIAGLGADLDADFEISSISKGVTGLLYADALERGDIEADTKLGELLPIGDPPAADITLSSLSSHRSGLPRLPKSAQPLRRTIALLRHGTNPYGEDLDQLTEQARGVKMRQPKPRYSNLGFELLGHALAKAADTTYAELVRQRVAEPLGLDPFYIPATADELRPGAIIGTTRRGRPQEPWTGEALGPAGGIRASITSMARFAKALTEGTAPGMAALEPTTSFQPGTDIGAAWITIKIKGRAITWHNGGTGGFRSWIGIDRQTRTGVVVLTATSVSVDRHGFNLLAENNPER
ncbi:serine hydrolase [Glycomyces halotolerans]